MFTLVSNMSITIFLSRVPNWSISMSNIALNVKAMMSTEVAELTGKQHKHVLRDIEVIMAQLDEEKIDPNLGRSFKATEYKDAYGRNQKGYELDYEATMIVITGYNVVARAGRSTPQATRYGRWRTAAGNPTARPPPCPNTCCAGRRNWSTGGRSPAAHRLSKVCSRPRTPRCAG